MDIDMIQAHGTVPIAVLLDLVSQEDGHLLNKV